VYTQCPDCATIFRVTAEALRTAQGDVRCGVCATSFNALENLSEQPFGPAPASDEPSPDDSMTVEELPGNENIELSAPIELAGDWGHMVPRSMQPIHFEITGPGEIVATDNGDPTDMTAFPSLERKAFNGLALVIVRSRRSGDRSW
jgi:predicted Zn finger-like uncharacterized protein